MGSHNDIEHLLRIGKLSLHSERIGIVSHIKRTSRHILILGHNSLTDRFHRQPIGFHLTGVHVDIDLTLRGTGYGHRTNPVNPGQGIGHIVIQNLIECFLAFFSLNRQDDNRNHIRRKLEDNRRIDFIRQYGTDHIQFVTHIVCQDFYIITKLKFKGNYRSILARIRSDVFQMFHGIQCIFQRSGHIIFHIGCRRSRISGDNQDRIGLNVRIEIYRQL